MQAYLIAAIGLLLAVCAILWNRYDAADDRADAAEAALTVEKANERIETKVIKEIVHVPGPTIVRERLAGLCHTITLPSAGVDAGAVGGDPNAGQTDGARILDGIAADLPGNKRNALRCAALIEVIRPQVE